MIRRVALCLAILTSSTIASDRYAIDGDTIVVGKEHIRIANIDTPEIKHAKCDAERRLGVISKARMQALINAGALTIERGDSGRTKDRYGRTLGKVTVNGKDVGEVLIAEGLARRWDGKRHPWCETE